MKNYLLLVLVLTLLGVSTTDAALENFTAAEPDKEVKPIYPIDRFADGSEISIDDGQIEMRFVVTANGSIAEPAVVRTSMEKFIDPTIRALENSSYLAATSNGKSVDSVVTKTYMFHVTAADLRNTRGSSTSFTNTRDNGVPDGYQSHYDEFTEELEKKNSSQEKAADLLDRMIELKHQSYYSLAYHSLARYRFADKFQGGEEKIAALKDLVWFDPQVKKKFRILKGDLRNAIWTSLLKEQIQAGYYADALATYEEFSTIRPNTEMPFKDAIAQITALKENNQVVQRSIAIPASGTTHLALLKKSFTFIDVEGSVSNLLLRCNTRVAKLQYTADAQFELPKSWGDCFLQVDGEAGTTANLLMQ